VLVGGKSCPVTNRTATRIDCTVPPGVGRTPVWVTLAQLQSQPRYFYYGSPVVTGVSGCPGGNTGCATGAMTLLTVDGLNFGASGASVVAGGQSCRDVVHDAVAPDHRLKCYLPLGTGTNLPIWVINAGGDGLGNGLVQFSFSYAIP
jgi:hypothetical protein